MIRVFKFTFIVDENDTRTELIANSQEGLIGTSDTSWISTPIDDTAMGNACLHVKPGAGEGTSVMLRWQWSIALIEWGVGLLSRQNLNRDAINLHKVRAIVADRDPLCQ